MQSTVEIKIKVWGSIGDETSKRRSTFDFDRTFEIIQKVK